MAACGKGRFGKDWGLGRKSGTIRSHQPARAERQMRDGCQACESERSGGRVSRDLVARSDGMGREPVSATQAQRRNRLW